jgi:hypothetical protein
MDFLSSDPGGRAGTDPAVAPMRAAANAAASVRFDSARVNR